MEALEQRMVLTISVMGSMVNEASGTLAFTYQGDGMNADPLIVDYATSNGTAVSPADFSAVTGSVTIAPYDTASHSVSVSINNDTESEADQSFNLTFTDPATNEVVATGTGTIQDDDSAGTSTGSTDTLGNNRPVAVDDGGPLFEIDNCGCLIGANPTTNDTDADGDSLTWDVAVPPIFGQVVPLADGSFRYVAPADFEGDDQFGYWAHDAFATSANVGIVRIKVRPKVQNDGEYKFGNGDPPMDVDLDPGAGGWATETPTQFYTIFRANLLYLLDHPNEQAALNSFASAFNSIFPGVAVPIFSFGPEAVAHMKHFLGNTGNDAGGAGALGRLSQLIWSNYSLKAPQRNSTTRLSLIRRCRS